jgi:hypothetical protein
MAGASFLLASSRASSRRNACVRIRFNLPFQRCFHDGPGPRQRAPKSSGAFGASVTSGRGTSMTTQRSVVCDDDPGAERTADLVDRSADPLRIVRRGTIQTHVPNVKRRHLQREKLAGLRAH